MLTISMLIMFGSFLMSLSRLVAHSATATAEPEAFFFFFFFPRMSPFCVV